MHMSRKHLFLVIAALLLSGSLRADYRVFSNSNFARIDGIKLHYRIWEPERKTTKGNVLMVHGFSGSTFSWQQAADSLTRAGYFAVAVDVPPFGYSDRAPRQNQSVTARAGLLHNFLQQEFPGTAWHLAGHSMGGGIVQAMALMYPESYESVTLVAPSLFSRIQKGRASPPAWMLIPGLTAFAGNLAESWFITRSRIEELLTSAYGIPPDKKQIDGYLEPLLVPGTARGILHAQRFREEIAEPDITTLSVPALAIWGENDTWVPLQSRKHILEKAPEITLSVINNAGHNPMETHIGEFMSLWLHFLNNL